MLLRLTISLRVAILGLGRVERLYRTMCFFLFIQPLMVNGEFFLSNLQYGVLGKCMGSLKSCFF